MTPLSRARLGLDLIRSQRLTVLDLHREAGEDIPPAVDAGNDEARRLSGIAATRCSFAREVLQLAAVVEAARGPGVDAGSSAYGGRVAVTVRERRRSLRWAGSGS